MYNEYKIIEKLQNAYGASTMSTNHFARAIAQIAWDEQFQADGESYFVKGKLTITVQDLDPFKALWKPCWMMEGCCQEF